MNEGLKAELLKAAADLEKAFGEQSVATLEDSKKLKVKFWKTGIDGLDRILGGGMPEGKLIEIYGAFSSGKTSLAYHLMGMHEYSAIIPIEGALDPERAIMFGCDPKKTIVANCQYGEQAMSAVLKFVKAGIPIVVLDSLPASVPRESYEKAQKAFSKGEPFDPRIGAIPRMLAGCLYEIVNEARFSGTTVIFINQIRDRINAPAFSETTRTPGGRIMEHMPSVRLQLARKSWIEVPNKDPEIYAEKQAVGINIRMKVVKSNVGSPNRICEAPMLFDRGFVAFEDVEKARKDIMAKNREKNK